MGWDVPQIPSFTCDEGILAGLCPAFVQWKKLLGQAAVPGSSLPSGQSQ